MGQRVLQGRTGEQRLLSWKAQDMEGVMVGEEDGSEDAHGKESHEECG